MLMLCAILSMLLLLVAAGSDLMWRTIPNALPLGIAASFAIGAIADPVAIAPLASLAVGAAVFAVGVPLFGLNVLGGGDVKLLAATALWAGVSDVVALLFVTAIAGGLLGVAVGVWWAWRRWWQQWATASVRDGLAAEVVTVPYGVAIAIAGIAVLWQRL
tara:strand:- start:87 stop:566 length:480 start_codon:yes stop_codon:yes gene_type:complete